MSPTTQSPGRRTMGWMLSGLTFYSTASWWDADVDVLTNTNNTNHNNNECTASLDHGLVLAVGLSSGCPLLFTCIAVILYVIYFSTAWRLDSSAPSAWKPQQPAVSSYRRAPPSRLPALPFPFPFRHPRCLFFGPSTWKLYALLPSLSCLKLTACKVQSAALLTLLPRTTFSFNG